MKIYRDIGSQQTLVGNYLVVAQIPHNEGVFQQTHEYIILTLDILFDIVEGLGDLLVRLRQLREKNLAQLDSVDPDRLVGKFVDPHSVH